MKDLRYFPVIFIVQVLLLTCIPQLTVDFRDLMSLITISFVFALIFMFGTIRIIAALSTSQTQFNAKYFGAMGLRMLMGIILIVIYLKFNKVLNKAGIIFLICSYFVLMGFEIAIILSKLRSDSEKAKNTGDARK